jgi:phosphate transport system substrate-binding protein
MRVYSKAGIHRWIFIAIIFLLSDCSGKEQSHKLVIPGTGACEFILREVALKYNRKNRGKTIIVPPSTGSSGGIRSVGKNEAILGRVARKLKADERGYDLVYLPFALDAVVFAVSKNIEISGLSSVELADIFSGKTRNWKDLGFRDGNIYTVIREPGDSSLTSIRKKIPEFKDLKFTNDARIQYRDYEMFNILEKYSNTIGFLTRSSLINSNIRILKLNGIAPSSENIMNGAYSMVSEYALVYWEGSLNSLAESFLDFLFSADAEKILTRHGLIHLKRK